MLIYSRDNQEHVKLVHKVLKTLYQNKLFAEHSKWAFHKEELDSLGYHISRVGPREHVKHSTVNTPRIGSNSNISLDLPTSTAVSSLISPKKPYP